MARPVHPPANPWKQVHQLVWEVPCMMTHPVRHQLNLGLHRFGRFPQPIRIILFKDDAEEPIWLQYIPDACRLRTVPGGGSPLPVALWRWAEAVHHHQVHPTSCRCAGWGWQVTAVHPTSQTVAFASQPINLRALRLQVLGCSTFLPSISV